MILGLIIQKVSGHGPAAEIQRRILTSPGGSRQAVMVYNDFKMSLPAPAGTGTAAFQRDVKRAAEVAFCGN